MTADPRLAGWRTRADAALVGGQRVFKAHLAVFHLLDQLFERVQRLLEIGDGRGLGCGFGGGFAWHRGSVAAAP